MGLGHDPSGAVNVNEQTLFAEALERPDPRERAAFLDQACQDDPGLRQRIERLLAQHQHAGDFLESSPLPPARTIDGTIPERPGTVIGPYKLLEQIGEGGMGVVFMAEQQQPIRRKVALKVLKPGMDTRQVIARFEAERQALALMDHRNIAKVLDAGQTSSGRPYFVMDLVKGIPVTEYCDENQLPVRERLELFVHVCQAVQHAHQKGIIHRDIKPTNLLVTLHDGTPVPKIIDFGIAKALGQQLTDKTLFTGFAQLIGTPMYMSPEQAALGGLDVDTRSDIYSLGVLLYELLTGATPFDKERFSQVGYDAMRRIIREEEPPKPSTRISTLGQGATTVSTQRKCDPKRLSQIFRGELDWIVMKCLEKDRNRRYETANSLAADIQHYLRDEPVLACPPSAAYRFGKFARSYRTALSTGALILVTVVAGLTISTILIAQERDKARGAAHEAQQQAEEAEKERQRAETNLLKAKEAVDKLFTEVAERLTEEPHMEQIRNALLSDALRFYQEFLQQKNNDPVMRHEAARAYTRAGSISQMLGDLKRAEDSHRAAIELLERLVAEFPVRIEYKLDLATAYGDLAFCCLHSNRHHDEIDAARKRLALLDKLATDYPTVPKYWQQLARGHTHMANALLHLYWEKAEEHFQKSLAIWQRVRTDFPQTPSDDFGISQTHHWYGALLKTMGRSGEAEVHLRQALEIRKQLVKKSPASRELQAHLAHIESYVGDVFYLTGKTSEAERHYREAANSRETGRGFPSQQGAPPAAEPGVWGPGNDLIRAWQNSGGGSHSSPAADGGKKSPRRSTRSTVFGHWPRMGLLRLGIRS
jgi:serine/threonine protein kinase